MSVLKPSRRRYLLWVAISLSLIFLANQMVLKSGTGRDILATIWGLNLGHYYKMLSTVSGSKQESIEQELLAARSADLADSPGFSHQSGFYPNGLILSLATVPEGSVIHFSTDGSIPTRNHPVFSSPIEITSTTVVRAKAFKSGKHPSATITASFIVNKNEHIPSVNIVTDPVFLHDKHSGIYSNPFQKGRGWERPAVFSILDPVHGVITEEEIKLRIHGGTSRAQAKKSFRIYRTTSADRLKKWLGDKAGQVADSQTEWVLRYVPNNRQLYADRFINRVTRQLGLPTSIIQPVFLYLNGEFLGVYDLMERINKNFYVGKDGKGDYDFLHGPALVYPPIKSASNKDWRKLYRYIAENDLSETDAYQYVSKRIDIENLIDYFALSIFMADSDRPTGNIDLFRDTSSGGKWKFAVWDFDGGLNYEGMYINHNTLKWHLRESEEYQLKPHGSPDDLRKVSATTLFRNLMKNNLFRSRFKSRFEELLAGIFSSERLRETYESMRTEYAEAAHSDNERYLNAPRYKRNRNRLESLDERFEQIEEFIEKRPIAMKLFIKEQFDN